MSISLKHISRSLSFSLNKNIINIQWTKIPHGEIRYIGIKFKLNIWYRFCSLSYPKAQCVEFVLEMYDDEHRTQDVKNIF